MKRKLLLVFLTLSIFNLYAASDDSQPLLGDCKTSLRIELASLETVNDWKDWIKAHGTSSAKYHLEAIEAVAEYAEQNRSVWNDLYYEIFENSSCCFCFGKSKFINFFFEVQQKLESRKFQRDLDEFKATFEVKTREVEDLREKTAALEQKIRKLREQKAVEQTSLVESPNPVSTEADMSKVSEAFTSQIKELRAQLDELKASISTGDPELTVQIQSLSEKVDAMDLEGIRADVNNILTYIGISKGESVNKSLLTRFDNMTHMILALYDFIKETPGFDYKNLTRIYSKRKKDALQKQSHD